MISMPLSMTSRALPSMRPPIGYCHLKAPRTPHRRFGESCHPACAVSALLTRVSPRLADSACRAVVKGIPPRRVPFPSSPPEWGACCREEYGCECALSGRLLRALDTSVSTGIVDETRRLRCCVSPQSRNRNGFRHHPTTIPTTCPLDAHSSDRRTTKSPTAAGRLESACSTERTRLLSRTYPHALGFYRRLH